MRTRRKHQKGGPRPVSTPLILDNRQGLLGLVLLLAPKEAVSADRVSGRAITPIVPHGSLGDGQEILKEVDVGSKAPWVLRYLVIRTSQGSLGIARVSEPASEVSMARLCPIALPAIYDSYWDTRITALYNREVSTLRGKTGLCCAQTGVVAPHGPP